ncbi:MAG: hypothetical protein Kow0022_15460 [Phycisphaerales bacterium]
MQWALVELSAAGILLASLLCGCRVMPDRSAGRTPESPIGDWVLSGLQQEPADVAVPRTARTPTLRIADSGEIVGTAGVNQYFGSISADKLAQGLFETGPVTTTRMMGPPQAMALERRFLDLLQQARRFHCDAKTLTLRDDRQTLLEFVRADRE